MSTRIQLIATIICTLFALHQAQSTCDFTPPQNLTSYNIFQSITKLNYGGYPPDEDVNYMGKWKQIAGINDNGTIYLIGGIYDYQPGGVTAAEGPVQWWESINVYDSFLSYDDTVDIQETKTVIQSAWSSSMDAAPYYSMPDITRPAGARYQFPITFNLPTEGGFHCSAQCATYLNNRVYIINPVMFSQYVTDAQASSDASWPLMIIFDMDDSNPHYLSQSEFASVPPNNTWIAELNGTGPFDDLRLEPEGCTTHNNTHIFHFNWAQFDYFHANPAATTYAYHPETDEWTILSPNPIDKYGFACSPDLSGRYIYLLAGIETYHVGGLQHNDASFGTDRYDTWTDTWTRLPSSADYPEQYGVYTPSSLLDHSTNSIILTGGRIFLSNCDFNCWIDPKKVEVFRVETEDWFVPSDPKDQIFFEKSTSGTALVMVEGFVPQGQAANASADMIFAFGGWGENNIQFMTMLTEQEYYPDDTVRIEGEHPDDEAIEWTAFDPWQRFELSFRIVITDGIAYEIDESWNISFTIDGKSIEDINDEYDTQILTRPACQCFGKQVSDPRTPVRCENMPDNVKQVTIVELMIPSRRTLHNGYCVDRELPWIFSYENASNITLTATNGQYTHVREFEFEFMKIHLVSPEKANSTGIIRGCKVTNASHGALTQFEISCDGYTCDKCPTYSGIGRDSKKGRMTVSRNEIEYNILMNDVLLAPDGYVRQDFEEYSVIGTESLNTDSLIALVRARTAVGTWYQECFYNFSYSFTKDWQSLESILNDVSNQNLWDDVVDKLNSNQNEDVIAAYSILTEMIAENEVPQGEDPSAEITDALQNIMGRTSTNNATIGDITANLALVDLLTSDSALVEADVVLQISSEFIPDILNETVSLLCDAESDYEPGVLADTVQNIGEIANSAATNLLNVTNLTEPVRQQLVNDVQQIMTTGMTGSWQGEVILLVRDKSTTKGYTINKDDGACELNDIVVRIPPHNAATSSDTVKCVITSTDTDEVAVDLFSGTGTRVFRTNDTCFPYLISMNVPDTYDGVFDSALDGDWYNTSIQYPKCTFWNASETEWSGEGCVVYEMDRDSVTCACTHLTTFKVSAEDFDPKAELITHHDMRQFTGANVEKYPTTWVTMVMIVVVLFVACVCVPNNAADRPIIAFEDIIYKEFRDQYLHKHQQWHEIQQIDRWYGKIAEHKRELSVGSDSYASSGVFGVGVAPDSPVSPESPSSVSIAETPSGSAFAAATFDFKNKTRRSSYYCLLAANLFKTYLKNDHTVLSVFQRTDGTNFSTKQRIGLFLLYMYMVMMADAIFYGRQEERRPIGELTASALISLFGTLPVSLVRTLFMWSKPRVVKSARALPPLMKDASSPQASAPNKTVEMMQATMATDDKEKEESISDQVMKDEELRERRRTADVEKQKRVSSQYWSAIARLKATRRPDMKLVRKCMHYVNTEAHASEKATLTQEIRLILFNYNYPFPHWYKKVAWTLLITASVVCVLTSVVYGIRFDLRADEMATQAGNEANILAQMSNITANDSNDACWNNMSIQLDARTQVLSQQVIEIQEEQARIGALDEAYPDDFDVLFGGENGAMYDSTKWLLNVLISFLMSVFIWQPASIYFMTWLKIWAFHNGFMMECSLSNGAKFIANYLCCGCVLCGHCFTKRSKNKRGTMLQGATSGDTMVTATATITLPTITPDPHDANIVPEISVTELSHTTSGYDEMLSDDRELDVIGFLCLDDIFCNLPEDLAVDLEQIAYD